MFKNIYLENIQYKSVEDMFNSYLFKQEIEMNIRHILLGRKAKCNLNLSIECKDCFTDGKTITIGMMDSFKGKNLLEVFALIKGLAGHEASHVKWSNFDELKVFKEKVLRKKYNVNLSMYLANIIEDGRIERLLCEELKGYIKYIKFLNICLIYEEGYIEDVDFLTNLFNTILFISKLGILPLNFSTIFDDEEQEFIEKRIKPLIFKGILADSHKTVLDLTLDIIDLISINFPEIDFNNINNELESLITKNLDPMYNTYEGFNTNNTNTPLNKNTDSKMDLNAYKDNVKPSNHMLNSNMNDAINDLKVKISNDFKNLNRLEELEKIKKRNENDKDNYFKSIDLDKINNIYPKELQEPNFNYDTVDLPYTPYPKELSLPIRILETQLKRLIRNDDSLSKNQRRGKLNTSSLWKIDSIYDKNVFIKKNNRNKSDYAVYILIDLSGSMSESIKYTEAINTAIKIEGALVNLEGVDVKTVGFNYCNGSKLKVFKEFKDKKSKTTHALTRDYSQGCNRDGFAIRVALEDLKKHSSKNNLLVIISDGRPLWDYESCEEAMKDVKKAVHEGRKFSTIMSILINEGEISKHVENCFHYMYEDKGTIMVDVKDKSRDLTNLIALYLKQLLKKR